MFEDSLALSYAPPQPRSRWLLAVSFALQVLVVIALIVVPLLHPAPLEARAIATLLAPPLPPRPQPMAPTPHVHPVIGHDAAASVNLPANTVAPRIPTSSTEAALSDAPALAPGTLSGVMNPSAAAAALIGEPLSAPVHVVTTGSTDSGRRTTHAISSGVSAGLLLAPIRPVYPAIARAARQSGTVVVEATISANGAVTAAHAISGPAMLTEAAITAVREAHYRPFLLNGEPTAVAATFVIRFQLGEE